MSEQPPDTPFAADAGNEPAAWFVLSCDAPFAEEAAAADEAIDGLAAGLRAADAARSTLADLVPDAATRRSMLRTLLAQDRGVALARIPAGVPAEARCSFFPHRDRAGRLTGLLAVIDPAPDGLRESEARYRGIFDTAADAILLIGTDGRVRDANPAACALYGHTREAFVGMHGSRFVHPGHAHKFRDALAAVSRGDVFCTQSMDVRRDGTAFPIEVRIAPFTHRGERVLLCSIRDTTERERAAEALRRSESLYRALFENAMDAIFLSDPETGSIVDANRRAQALVGRRLGELRGLPLHALHPPEVAARALEAFRRAGEAPETRELPVLRGDGALVPAAVAWSRIGPPHGPVLVLGMFRDLSERRRAEDALFESRARLAEAQRLARIGSWEWRVGEDEIHLSEELHRICGLPPGPGPRMVRGEAFMALVHENDRAALHALVRDALAGRRPYRTAYRIRTPAGELRHVQAIGAVVREDGRATRMYGTIQDVTELHQAEEALRSSNERFATIMDSINALIYVADMDTYEVLFMNRHARELFPDAVGKKCWATIQQGQSGPCAFCNNAALLGPDGEPTGLQVWEFQNSRNGRWFQCNDRAVRWIDGKYVRLEIALDITERKRAEEQIRQLNDSLERRVAERTAELAAAVRELESFSYSASHDLRTPLRAIEGFSTLLQSDHAAQLDEQGIDCVARIRRAAQHMAQLIDDLLDLARLSRRPLKRAEVDLSAIARTVAEELRERDPQRRVVFELRPQVRARADAVLIRVVMANLLENAWKFTGRTQAARVVFEEVEAGGEPAYVVRDNGAGFDMVFAHKLFGAFQRLHGPAEYEGTGIGLATVQRIVQRHGGRVWAESAPGRGASFYFTLGAGTPSS